MVEILFNNIIPTAVNVGVKTILSKPLSRSLSEKKDWIKEKSEEISSVERVIDKNSKILNSETERQTKLISSVKEIDSIIDDIKKSGIDVPELEDLIKFRSLLSFE